MAATDFISFPECELLITHMPSLSGDHPERKREEIRAYFHKTFSLNEKIFEYLKSDQSFYQKANNLRHPLIFYFGHPAVFFINKLYVAGLINQRIDERIESMLAVGVDEMSWDDLDEKNYDWPTVEEVRQYRHKVRTVVDDLISSAKLEMPITWENPFWIVLMGIEHERIHIETSSVLMRELPIEYVTPNPLFPVCDLRNSIAPKNELVAFEGGTITLGKNKDNAYYGWDNEYGSKDYKVQPFKASKYLVSNQEFYEFVLDQGYETKTFWSEEGWQWKTFRKARMPRFWVEKNKGQYLYRTIAEEIPMPWSWPVDLNFHEAKAFCRWKSQKLNKNIRMPTEAEWMLLRNQVNSDQPTWKKAPGNINLEYWASACPVDQFVFENGLYDVIGNVWQWSESPIDALPGFEVHPIYDDFSVPTFDGKHNLIKGGCFFSTGNYALKTSRYAFRRHFFQHAGLRYMESEYAPDIATDNPYETDNLSNQYMEFQYGEKYFGVDNFAKTCAEKSLAMMKDRPKHKALDLGCAVGRTSFELAREFDHVDGIDFSTRFILSAVELQNQGSKRFTAPIEGEIVEYKTATLKDLKLDSFAKKCRFMQGDACNLDPKYTGYDLIFAGNLIDRLYQPEKFLQMIHTRLKAQGLLVLTSPYTWLEEYTPKSNWVGGFKKNGENYLSLDGLKDQLTNSFELLKVEDVPFVIRETKRKFQHTVAQLTIWQRK